jgi:CRP-like cAMP-binding protein
VAVAFLTPARRVDVALAPVAAVRGAAAFRLAPAVFVGADAARNQPHGLYVRAKGGVEVFRSHPDGVVVPSAKLAAVDCFGEFAAINGEPGSASVRSLTPCTVGEIPPAAFRSLLTERPGLSMRVLHKLVNRIQNLDDTVEALHLRNSVRDAQVREVYRQLSLGSL